MSEESGGRIGRVIESGARLLVALSGSAAGVVTGDPFVGAATGWAAGELLTVGQDVMERVTESAAVRVGAAVLVIHADRHKHERHGEEPRTDGFFDNRGALRPEAHELLEGILLASANCFEERKLPYLAHMFNGVAYDANVSPSDALFLARLADQLTFRQLRALAVCGRHGDADLEVVLAQLVVQHNEGSLVTDPALLREFNDLADRGLIGVSGSDGVVRGPQGRFGGGLVSDSPAQAALTESGRLLHQLMRLGEMPEPEQSEWIEALRGRPRSTDPDA